MNRTVKGYILGAVAAASYGMNPLFALPLYEENIKPDMALLYRYFIAAVLMALILIFKKESFRIRKNEIIPLIFMGLLFSLSSLFLFESYNHMAAGIASTILFVYPIMVAVINAVFFKEKISVVTVISILIATVGIGLLYKGEDGAVISTLGVVLVMLSSLSYAIYMIAINKSVLSKLSPTRLTFYALVFGTIFFIVRVLSTGDFMLPPSSKAWFNAFGLAVMPTVLSFLTMSYAVRIIGSTYTSILGALEPITAVFIGVMLFGESLTFRLVVGIVLILIAVTLIIFDSKLRGIIERKFLNK